MQLSEEQTQSICSSKASMTEFLCKESSSKKTTAEEPAVGLGHWEEQRRQWMQDLPHPTLTADSDITNTKDDPPAHHDPQPCTPQLRKFVPENYGVIYDHLIRHRRTLTVPIPLSHVIKVIVHGWQRDGLWMEAATASAATAALPVPQPTFGSPPPDTASCLAGMSLSTFRIVGDTLVTTDATPAPPPLPSVQAIRDLGGGDGGKPAHR
ncbi:hypothetical protein BDF19DRAFT_449642 [Syncephalis fuscata]|nr:hypothetical protein BDF19DRAFT_449642 [Syncephalis fuscata]